MASATEDLLSNKERPTKDNMAENCRSGNTVLGHNTKGWASDDERWREFVVVLQDTTGHWLLSWSPTKDMDGWYQHHLVLTSPLSGSRNHIIWFSHPHYLVPIATSFWFIIWHSYPNHLVHHWLPIFHAVRENKRGRRSTDIPRFTTELCSNSLIEKVKWT